MTCHRFLKTERILKSVDFKAVYKSSKRMSSKNFFVVWRPSEIRHIGITVSAKVGKSNIRNRIKRVIREFFRLNKERFPLGDCVVTARPSAGFLENDDIRKEMNSIFGEKNA